MQAARLPSDGMSKAIAARFMMNSVHNCKTSK
jgi:hypothetical protein